MATSTTFNALRINNAEQLKESVNEAQNTKLYFCYGRIREWQSPYDDEYDPQPANSSVSTIYEVWNNMIGGKRINGSDICHVIPRYNWTSNTKYTSYDNLDSTLYDANVKFYVVNSNYDVYKCISNNYSSNSTVEPTSVNPSVDTITSDGYIWKYMYTISDNDIIRFTTDDYIPVKTIVSDDGSTQWRVQEAAIDGGVNFIKVEYPGNYYTEPEDIKILIEGDGTGLSAYAVVNSNTNTVNNIIVTNPGSGYTYADILVAGGLNIPSNTASNTARARAIISPPGGHGSDPLYELGGKNLMFNIRLMYDEDGVLPTTNEFRQVSIFKDVLDTTSNVMSNTAFLQTYVMQIDAESTDNYNGDEIVYQGRDIANSTFSGEVVQWDYTNSRIYLINTKGTPSVDTNLNGVATSKKIIAVESTGQTIMRSGKLLYTNNLRPISRSPDQIEDFKILVKF